MINKNPFSLYDFLGYVFPGFFALFLISIFYKYEDQLNSFGNILDLFIDSKETIIQNSDISIVNTTFFLIGAYILGHFIAYLSSVTVERFSVWAFGYPSGFLLIKQSSFRYFTGMFSSYPNNKLKCFVTGCSLIIWRAFIALLLLPIFVITFTIGYVLRVNNFLTKRMDDSFCGSIRIKLKRLSKILKINIDKKNDYHRLIYHYEYEKKTAHRIKMDNYVAMYGFLRSITFIFSCMFIYLLYVFFVSSIWNDDVASFNWALFRLLLFVGGIEYLLFMGFMKFYRRFTLESFMCLITDEDL